MSLINIISFSHFNPLFLNYCWSFFIMISVDLVAHVFDVLKNDLKSDVCKELFLYYQATPVILQYLKPINKVKMNKVQAFIRLVIMNFHMIVHVWQAYMMCDTNVRFMHLVLHDFFGASQYNKALNHNMKMLQKQTISCESFKNVKYMMVSNYKLLYLYFEVDYLQFLCLVWFMVFNSTFNNISVILWWSVLLVDETGVSGENHWPAASHWQTLSHNVVLSTHCHERGLNSKR